MNYACRSKINKYDEIDTDFFNFSVLKIHSLKLYSGGKNNTCESENETFNIF